jgi:hypothetical protein
MGDWVGAAGLVLCAAGCERVVAVELPEGPERLVVEARLEARADTSDGRQTVRLSTTDAFFSGVRPPPATGAVVRVTDDRGVVVPFPESGVAGTYTTTQLPVRLGRTYTLRVEWQGERYEAVTAVAPGAAIDTLYFAEPAAGSRGPRSGPRATIDLRDDGRVRNWYLWEQEVDGVPLAGPDSLTLGRVVASDLGFDGLGITGFQPFDGAVIRRGATVRLRQIGITEEMMRYYRALNEQVANGGTPFDVPLASVRGNVVGVSPNRPIALGYFFAGAVAERTARLAP